MADYSQVDTKLADAQRAFADALKLWMRQNNWPQLVTQDWSKSVGYPGQRPNASQMCNLLQCRLEPKRSFWIALAEFNRVVADQDLSPITDRKTRDRLKGAKPFYDLAGDIATATSFFSMFAGQQPIPAKYLGYDDKTAALYSNSLADFWEKLVMDHAMPPKLLWDKLVELMPIEPDPWEETVKAVALRQKTLTGPELGDLLQADYKDDPIFTALVQLDTQLKASYVDR